MKEFIFLGVEDVLLLHTDTIDIDGGSQGVREHGLLDAMAAAYLFHLAQNHPFVDGNKRAAVMAALSFLYVNGIENLPAPQTLEITTRQVAAGELSKDALTQWLRAQTGKRK